MTKRLSLALLCLLLAARLCAATITAATVWEVRPATGDNTFGACFDSTIANAGTDYSQQTTAQLSLTDIAVTTTAVTSTTGGFTAAMIGNCLRLNATGTGAHCVIGWYQITAYTSTNAVTIDRDATTGGAGVACSGKVGGATKSLAGQTTTALTLSTNGLQAGNTVYIKNEAWNEAVTTATGNSGTLALPITIEGYNSTRGDAPTGSNRPRNNRAAAAGIGILAQKTNWIWKHLWVSNAGAEGMQVSSASSYLINVRSSNNGTVGFVLAGSSTALVNCEADTNTTIGVDWSASGLLIQGSYLHNNTTIGLRVATGPVTVAQSIIARNSSHGIAITGNSLLQLLNSTIDCNSSAGSCGSSSVDGINVATTKTITAGSLLINNILSNNGRDGIRVTDASSNVGVWADYNDFYGNVGTARTNFPTGSHDVTTNPTYTNSAGGDYSIGSNLRNGGFPGTFPASTSVSYGDIGAVQSGAGSITQGACHRTVQ